MQAQINETSARGHYDREAQWLDAPSLVQDALDEADNNIAVAVDIVCNRVIADKALAKQLLPEMVKVWAREEVCGYVSRKRTKIAVVANSGKFSASLKSTATAEVTRLMEMPLYGGKRIGDAIPSEIRDSAGQYQAAALTMATRARWQSAVADAAERVAADKPTRETLSERDLQALWEANNAQ